jgi:hypothetical protein
LTIQRPDYTVKVVLLQKKRQATISVTPKRRRLKPANKQAREWKIAALAQLLEFALDTRSDLAGLQAQARALVRLVPQVKLNMPRDFLDPQVGAQWLERMRWFQTQAKSAIEQAASHKEWLLRAQQLTQFDPRDDPESGLQLTWYALGGSGHWEGAPEQVWLLSLKELLRFNQGFRIRRCKQAGCDNIFVGRTTGLYCDAHSTSAAKMARQRERLTVKERRARRRLYYENHKKRHPPIPGISARALRAAIRKSS